MFLVEKISKNIVSLIYSNDKLDKDEMEIIEYGVLITLLQIIGIVSVIISGSIFGISYLAIIFYFIVCILRKYSGGVHADSPNRCIIIGTSTSVFISLFIDRLYVYFLFYFIIILQIFLIIFCYYIIFKLAPVDSISKPIIDKKLKKYFKNRSIFIIMITTILTIILIYAYLNYKHIILLKISQCIIFACTWQCYTLTECGHKFVKEVDITLKYIYGVIKNEK